MWKRVEKVTEVSGNRKMWVRRNAEYMISQDYSMNLRNKMEAFKQASQTRKTVVMTMISTFGVKRNAHSGMVKQQVVLDDLFRQE